VLQLGLTKPVLDFEGKYYTYTDVPMALQPLQKPHPPFWYGVTRPESAAWAAKNRVNAVMNAGASQSAREPRPSRHPGARRRARSARHAP